MIASLARGIERLAVLPGLRWCTILTVVALGTRLAWSIALRERTPRFDEAYYVAHAVDVVAGRGYVDSAGVATALWPVGYPVALAGAYRVFGPGKATGVMLQIVLGVASCFLLGVVGTNAFGPGIGRASALALAVYPNHVAYSTLHLTEPLSVFLLLLAVLLLLRPNNLVAVAACGLVIGLTSLVRPMLILLPIALAFWYWRFVPSRVGALYRTALLGAFTAMTVSPWVIRNHELTGRWTTLSTSGGYAFWVGNHPGAFGGYKHDRAVTMMLRDGDRRDYEKGYQLGVDAILDAPIQAGVRAMAKLTHLFALETDGVLWNLKGLDRTTPLLLRLVLLGITNACYVIVALVAILGLLRAPPRDPLATLLIVFTGYMCFMSAVFLGDPRYHYPLIPLACVFAAYGVVNFPSQEERTGPARFGRRHVWTRWAVCSGLFTVMLIANVAIKVAEIRALGD